MDWNRILGQLTVRRLAKLAANAGIAGPSKRRKAELVDVLHKELDDALKNEALGLLRGSELRELAESMGVSVFGTHKQDLITSFLSHDDDDDVLELSEHDFLVIDRERLDVRQGDREETGVEVLPSRPGDAAETLFFELQELLRRSKLSRAVLVAPSCNTAVLERLLGEGLDDLIESAVRPRRFQPEDQPLVTLVLDGQQHGLGSSDVGRTLVSLASKLPKRIELRLTRSPKRLHAKVFAFQEDRREGPFFTGIVGGAQIGGTSSEAIGSNVRFAAALDADGAPIAELKAWVTRLLSESRVLDASDLAKLDGLPAAEKKVDYKLEFDTSHELRLKHLAEKLCRRGRYAGPLFDPMLLHTPPEHQREAIAGASQPWVEGYLLLDESGLGKTIEAGMILSRELRRRRIYASTSSLELRQALVVAPRALHAHWREELWAKFGLHTQVVTSDPRDGSELSSWRGSRAQVVITSPGTARAHWEDIQGFDLVLFDECQLYDEDTMAALGAIRSAARLCLVASSTPVRSDISDVLSLLGLAAPSEGWESYAALDAEAARDTLGAELRSVASRAYRSILLQEGKLFRRRMERRDYEFDDVEARAYAEIRKMRNDYMRRGGHETAWAFVALEQTYLSSPQVFHALLCRLMGEAEQGGERYLPADQHDDSFEFLRDSSYFQRRLRAVREALGSRTLPSASVSGKEACLLKALSQCPGERVLVYTRYRATQERLGTMLSKVRFGAPVELIDERSSLRERLGIVDRFAERTQEIRGDGPNGVLISTDRAAAGLDLQSSFSTLVNYDLPWDPLTIERRIGRLQRWGQAGPVRTYDLVAKTPDIHERSMDERVLEVCQDPFGMHNPTEPCNDALYALHPTRVVRHLAGDGTELTVIPAPNQVALAELDELLLGDRSAAHQRAVAHALEHDQTYRERIGQFWSRVSYGGSSLLGARGYLFGRLRLALLQGQIGVLCAPGRSIADCRKWSLAIGIRLMFEAATLDPGREPLEEDWLLEDEEVYLWAVDHDRKLLDWATWLTGGGLEEVPRSKAAELAGEAVITFMQARKQEIESRGLDAVPFESWRQGAPPEVADKLEVVSDHAAKMARQRMAQIRGDWDFAKNAKAELLKRRLELARSAEAGEEVIAAIQTRLMQLSQRRVELRQQVLGTQIFVITH